jgi:hypothetical protein
MKEISQEDRSSFLAEIDIKKLNNMALDFGLLIPDSQARKQRKEYTKFLGLNLTCLENMIYSTIDQLSSKHGYGSLKEIYEKVYKNEYLENRDKPVLRVRVASIRKKLGEISILTITGYGYKSTRAEINWLVEQNTKRSH